MASVLKKKKDKKEKDKDKEELDRLATLTEDQLRDYYREIKIGIWEKAWEMLHSDGWKLCSGKDCETGVVFSKHYKEYGKIFKLEGYIDMSVEETFKLLVVDLEDAPQWNHTILEAQVMLKIDDESDIAYNATAPAAGGLIATRDFVNLRHWSSRGDITLSAGRAVLHPSKPQQKNYIRGENGPGGWAFRKVPGSPDRCLFLWLMNTDLKGWLPKGLVDSAYPKAQLDYLENVRQHVKMLKSGQ